MILKYSKFLSLSVLLLTIFCFFQSCSDFSDCGLTANREIKITFGELSNKVVIDSSVNKVLVWAIGTDSVFYKGVTASQISLPLSQLADSSIFILQTDSISKDTIKFKYHRELQMVSSDCGFNTAYSSLALSKNYTTHKIDTILTFSTTVSSDVNINYEILLKQNNLIKSKK
jgi:hypothetical protein